MPESYSILWHQKVTQEKDTRENTREHSKEHSEITHQRTCRSVPTFAERHFYDDDHMPMAVIWSIGICSVVMMSYNQAHLYCVILLSSSIAKHWCCSSLISPINEEVNTFAGNQLKPILISKKHALQHKVESPALLKTPGESKGKC